MSEMIMALSTGGIFVVGIVVGAVLMVVYSSRREDRRFSLWSAPPGMAPPGMARRGILPHVARPVTGLGVSETRPGDDQL
jgi:hypothetical protein